MTAKGIAKENILGSKDSRSKGPVASTCLKVPGTRGRQIQMEWEEQTDVQGSSSKLSSHIPLAAEAS